MHIDIWSDIACPWCAIGRAQLNVALNEFASQPDAPEVEIRWRSFELNPNAELQETGDYVQRLADKYGMPRAKADEMVTAMVTRGKSLNVPFDFSIIRSGNTFDAHRLLHFAHTNGLQDALKNALFEGYFAEGLVIGDAEALVAVATSVGLDEPEVREILQSSRYAEDVRAEEAQARQLGIQGVPFFVIDQKYGISGAQPPDVLVQALQQAHAANAPVAAAGPGCDDNGCAV